MDGRGDYTRGWGVEHIYRGDYTWTRGGTIHGGGGGGGGGAYLQGGLYMDERGAIHGDGWVISTGGLCMEERGDYWGIYPGGLCMEGRGDYLRGGGGAGGGDYPWAFTAFQ